MEDRARAGLESIGRFARRSGIPVSQLRHYHDVGLLPAAYVDPESGYRYYAAAQGEAAEVIAMLRAIDMPVRDTSSACWPTRPSPTSARSSAPTVRGWRIA
jgi:DNA-binding transcriptional MerR regulator